MKGLLVAFASMLALGLHAVSVSWTAEGLESHVIQLSPAFGSDGNDYATFLVQGSVKSTDNYKWVFDVFGNATPAQNIITLGIEGGKWKVANPSGWQSPSAVTNPSIAATTGDFIAGFSLAKQSDGTVSVEVSINGSVVGAFSAGLYGASGTASTVSWVKWSDDYVTVDRVGFVSGDTPDCALTAEQIALLPEPGALALLALGLAGLTLRRRAA